MGFLIFDFLTTAKLKLFKERNRDGRWGNCTKLPFVREANDMRNSRRLFNIQNTGGVLSWCLAVFLCRAAPTLAQAHAISSASPALRPELIVQAGHAGEIASMAFSPDGSKFATAESDGTIKFWDLHTGDLLRTTSVEGGGMGSQLAFSPDGRIVAALSGQYTVVLLDSRSGKPVRSLKAPNQVSTIGFARDSPLIAMGCPDASLYLWNWQTGAKIRSITTHVGWVGVVSLSNDGSLLACAAGQFAMGNTSAEIWNTHTGGLVRTIHTGSEVYAATFSPDGKAIALGVGGFPGNSVGTELWNLTRGERTQQLKGREFQVSSLAYSKDGSTVTAVDEAGIVRVWDIVRGELLKASGKHGFVVPTAVSSDGRFAAVSSHTGAASVYEATTGRQVLELQGATHVMHRMVACSEGRTLITGGTRTGPHSRVGELLFWDMQTGICTGSFQWGEDLGSWGALSASPDGRYVAVGDDTKAAVWDVPARRLLATFAPSPNEKKRIMAVAVSPDGRLLVIGGQRPNPAAKRAKPRGFSSGPKSVSTQVGFLEIWSVADHTKLRDCAEANEAVDSVVFSKDGTEVIGNGVHAGAAVWDVNTGAILKRYSEPGDSAFRSLNSISASKDGETVAAVGDGDTFHVWTRSHSEQPREFHTSGYTTFAVALAPDGSKVVVGGPKGDLHLWSVKSGSQVRSFGGGGTTILSLAYVQHGAAIASLDSNQGLRIWDASTGKLKAALCALSTAGDLNSPVDWVASTADGYYTGSRQCEARIRWRVGDEVLGPDGYRTERNLPGRVETALNGKVEAGRYERLFQSTVVRAPVAFADEPDPKTTREAKIAPDPNTPDGKLYRGLTTMSWMGNERRTARAISLVKEGLASGANIDLQGGWGTSALMLLSYCGDLDAVKDLVRRGANVNLIDVYGSTALLHAVKGKKLPIFDYLLAKGAALGDENGLPLPALKGKPEALGAVLVRILARRDIFDLYFNNTDEIDTQKVREFDSHGVALALLQLGASPSVPGKEGKTPLQFANDLDVVEALLSRGADIDAHAADSETALCRWVGQGWIDHVKVGLEHGADVNLASKSDGTPLMIAASRGDFNMVKLLLEHHANPNLQDKDGQTALMAAVSGKHVDILVPLLDAGARLETKDNYSKYTALAFAVQGHDLEAARILLSRGADIRKSGANLLKLARDQDKSDSFGVAALLKKYGAAE